MYINVTDQSGFPVTGVKTEFNSETGNHEANVRVDENESIYVEVQISEEQVAVANAYTDYLQSEYFNEVAPLKGFGTFLEENY